MARHLKEVAEGVAKLAGSIPNRADLVGSQRALPLALRARHFDQSDRARLDNPALERPIEELADSSERPVRCDRFALVDDRVQKLYHVAPRDRLKVPAAPARENVLVEIPTCLCDVSRRPLLASHVALHELVYNDLDPVGSAPCCGLLLVCRITTLPHRFV